jgi:hypothetical protein
VPLKLPFFAAALLVSAAVFPLPFSGGGEAAGVDPNRPEKIDETFDKPLPVEKAPWVRAPMERKARGTLTIWMTTGSISGCKEVQPFSINWTASMCCASGCNSAKTVG